MAINLANVRLSYSRPATTNNARLETSRLLRASQRELSRIDRHVDLPAYVRAHADIYRHRLALRLLLTRPIE